MLAAAVQLVLQAFGCLEERVVVKHFRTNHPNACLAKVVTELLQQLRYDEMHDMVRAYA